MASDGAPGKSVSIDMGKLQAQQKEQEERAQYLTKLSSDAASALQPQLPEGVRCVVIVAHPSGQWAWASGMPQQSIASIFKEWLAGWERRIFSAPWWDTEPKQNRAARRKSTKRARK